MNIVTGFTLIDGLPKGNWELEVLNGIVIAVCPEHEPRIVVDGKLETLKPSNEPVFVDWP